MLLFVVLWVYGKKPRGLGQVSGVFLLGYGVLRFVAEFFREPDSFLGLLALDMSMGQWLCVPMIVAGVALWLWGRGRAPSDAATAPAARRGRPEPTMRQIFLDTETTGLSPESGDRIIEIGCVEIVNRRLTGRRVHFYVNPERRNSIDAYKVHGLSDEFLADKPLFGHIVDELIEFVRGAEIIIHNAAFDIGFLDAELRRIGRPAFLEHGVRVTDTLVDGARQLPRQVELARCAVQALRGQQHRTRAARRAARRGPAGRGLHPHDARPGLAGHRCRRRARPPSWRRRPIDFSTLYARRHRRRRRRSRGHAAMLAEIDKASGGRAVWRLALAVPDLLAMAQ